MSIESGTTVEAVMATPVETISKDASIRNAAAKMRDHDFNALLVPGADMGIITSTDILDVVANGLDTETTQVADVMTVPVESVTTDLKLPEAASMMTTYRINHLPVRDNDGDYVGMVSSTDLRNELTG